MKQKQNIEQKQIKGIQWNTIISILVFLIQFSTSFFLNKLISPEEFAPALWAYFLILFGLFFNGFSWFEIIVRDKTISKKQLSTGFWISALTNGFLFCLFFFGASYIAQFTKDFDATNYLKLFSIIFLIHLVAFIPNALMNKEIEFKKISQLTLIAKVISSILAFYFALTEQPFFSLVFLYAGTDFFLYSLITLQKTFIPSFQFDIQHVKEKMNLASTLTLQKFAFNIGNSLDTILIGKDYNKTEVSNYSKSYGVRSMPVTAIARSITKVTFPTLAKLQEEQPKFEHTFYRTQHLLAFILLPIYGLLFCIAEPFVELYFSKDWNIEQLTILLKIFSIAGAFASFESLFKAVMTIKSSAKEINQLTFIQKSSFIVLLFASLHLGIVAIALAKLASTIIDFFTYAFFSNRHLRKSYFTKSISLSPCLVNSVLSSTITSIFLRQFLTQQNTLFQFFIGSALFGILYLLLAFFLDKKGFKIFTETLFAR